MLDDPRIREAIDCNLRKKPDWNGTSKEVNRLRVRVCCRLESLFNNFAVGHITGMAACVQTTCMIIRTEARPSESGWVDRSGPRACHSPWKANDEPGGGSLRPQSQQVFCPSTFPSTHGCTCKAREPGSFTAQHEIQGAESVLELGFVHGCSLVLHHYMPRRFCWCWFWCCLYSLIPISSTASIRQR